MFGDYFFMNRRNFRIFGQVLFSATTPDNLYTPAHFLAANHTNPDSNISSIGETYKYAEGNRVLNEFGLEAVKALTRNKDQSYFDYIEKQVLTNTQAS